MLVDRYEYISNVLKGTKFIISVLDDNGETSTLIGEDLSPYERVWLADAIKKAVDAVNEG